MVKKAFVLLLLALVASQSFLTNSVRAACPPVDSTYGSASYSAPAASSGTFAVWARMMVPDATNKTFNLSINDGFCNVVVGNGAIPAGQWTWVNYRDGNVDSKMGVTVAAGTYTVQLGGTKPGVKVDKIMLVQSLSCVPVNDGSNCVVTSDTTAPSVPANLTSPSQTSESISLGWNNSTDATGVVRYDVYRGGTKVGSSTVNSYTDSNLQAATGYSYTVKAADAAGNVSAASSAVQVSTKPTTDTTPPVATLVTPKTGDTLSNTVTLNATAVDSRALATIKFYLDDYTLLSTVAVSGSTGSATYSLDTTKYANGSHRIHAVATDPSGNSASSAVANVTISNTFPDTSPPSVPGGLTVGAKTTNSILLSWIASTDNTGVTGYDVYRNGAKVSTVTGTQYTDQLLASSTTYSYYIRAVDAARNASAASSTLQATTLEATDTTAPTVALTAPAAGKISGVVAMAATAADNKAVAYVDFFANGYLVWRDTTAPYNASIDTTKAPNSTVPFTAVATDTAGNTTTSAPVTVTIANVAPDTSPPSAPQNLAATAVSTNQINLSWGASNDTVGVVGYEVYRNTTKIATVTTTSYGDTGLSAGTSYTYTVKARDGAGNVSSSSAAVTAVTQTVPPTTVQYGSVNGFVRDATSRQAAKGAKVSYILNGSRNVVQTLSSGYYYIKPMPYKTYNFTYYARGYNPATKPLEINQRSTSFDVDLTRR